MRVLVRLSLFALSSCVSSASDSAVRSNSSPECIAIADEYAAALPDARRCEPAVRDSCGAQRPLVVFKKVGDQQTLEGLCQCRPGGPAYVNPTRTARLDELLPRYTSNGCEIGFCPCPSPRTDGTPPCATNETGTGTCP